MIKVSIIVPVYNVQEYLEKCLNSIVSQTLCNIEIICVNDGSTDESLNILKKYKEKDERIFLIDRENGGYGSAVNLGIDYAKGKYIAIVEPDDYIEKNMFEVLYEIAEEENLEIIKADYYILKGKGKRERNIKKCLSENDKLYGTVINPQYNQDIFQAQIFTWAGIYKREFIEKNKIRHNETPGASYQDNGFWFQTFACAERVMFIRENFYHLRRDNEGSSFFRYDKTYAINDEYSFVLDFLLRRDDLRKILMPVYWKKCFVSHTFYYRKLLPEYREAFLDRFYMFFSTAQKNNLLDTSLFTRRERDMLFFLLNNIEMYPFIRFDDRESFLGSLEKKTNLCLWVYNFWSECIIYELLQCGKCLDIKCIIASNKSKFPETYGNIPVVDMNEYESNCEDTVLIAVGRSRWEESYKTLWQMGVNNILCYYDKWIEKKKVKFSVIVTIYNMEEYLNKCIDSILAQTYDGFEVILIDDKSTDSSGIICDQYEKRDSRIKVVHKIKNEGLVNARKTGVEIATGDYVVYVDADDWVEKKMLQCFYSAIMRSDADIIVANGKREYSDKSIKIRNRVEAGYYEGERLENELYCKMLYYGKFTSYGVLQYVWGKAYKYNLILEEQSKVDSRITNGEDVACVYPCILRAKSVEVIENIIYHYRSRNDSMTNITDVSFFNNIFILYNYLNNRFGEFENAEQMRGQLLFYIMSTVRYGARDALGILLYNKYSFEIGKIPFNSKIVLFGTKERGEYLCQQLNSLQYCKVVRKFFEEEFSDNEDFLHDTEYDYIVVYDGEAIKECILSKYGDDKIMENVIICI